MLKVFCVFWGTKYSVDYVARLRAMVARNLKTPHEFVCITDRPHSMFFGEAFVGMTLVNTPVEWPTWWQKLALFDVATGPSLYFDLDVVITGALDYLVPFTSSKFAAPANWAQSGHGGVQSSVMAWDGTWREPFERFNPDKDIKRLWGDQEFITEILGDDFVKLPGIYSYKYHCRDTGKPPKDCAVAVFHGKPDPHEVGEEWVRQFRCM